jgi:hypothetical protein
MRVRRRNGLADMAAAIAAGTPHRASGELAFHVLDIMESILTASASGHVVELSSTAGRTPCRCPTRRETQQGFRPEAGRDLPRQ